MSVPILTVLLLGTTLLLLGLFLIGVLLLGSHRRGQARREGDEGSAEPGPDAWREAGRRLNVADSDAAQSSSGPSAD